MSVWPAGVPQDPRDPGSPVFPPGSRMWVPGEAIVEMSEGSK